MTPEGRVKAKVKKALDQLGEECWRFMPVQSGYGSVALDFLLAIRGRFVAIETKTKGKTLTPLQESTKAAMEAAGALVFVVDDESSLAIAMKIILALEFSNGPQDYVQPIATLRGLTGYNGDFKAVRHGSPEEQKLSKQHLRTLVSNDATDPAAGGDHGASRRAPARRTQPAARGDD